MKSKRIMTICIICGILFTYALQMAPSPVLIELRNLYSIKSDSMLNMSVSIMFITVVLGCFVGAKIEQRIGTIRLFTLSMVFVILGGLGVLVTPNYSLFLVARLIYGLGYGLSIQFIGSAIMKYYDVFAREKMNTLNGMFPYLGTVLSFLLIPPISRLMGIRVSMAVWSVPIIIALVIWVTCLRESELPNFSVSEASDGQSSLSAYRYVWSKKPIRLLSIAFVCDFCCYSYVAIVVPTLFYEATNMNEVVAGLMSAIAFPAFGILGSGIGGLYLSKTGLRKPCLVAGQVGKFLGLSIATYGCQYSPLLLVVGICIFGCCVGMWMPALYSVPMDLPEMTPSFAGVAFSLMSALGMIMGFIAPTLGGLLTNVFMDISNIVNSTKNHVFGLQWSLFIFGCLNIISTICMLFFKETGTKRAS